MEVNQKRKSGKGLPVGTLAPPINAEDVFGTKIKSSELLGSCQGLYLDFFRGSW